MLTVAAGEEDKSGPVGFESFDIDGQRFGREVLATMVDGDANRRG